MPASGWKINLLPQSNFEISFWGKFVRWAITSGRYVVIVTELIVVMAFLSRFKLDMDISNLNQQITGQKNILDSQVKLETEFRSLQSRVINAGSLMAQNTGAGMALETIVSLIPPDVKIKSMKMDGMSVTITAESLSERGVGLFLSRMAAVKEWKSVELTQISEDKNKGLSFLVSINR